MAHFRGIIQGHRGSASRLGSKGSGLWVSADGWNGGVAVSLSAGKEGEPDHAHVALTTGSGHNGASIVLYDGPIDPETRNKLAKKKRT